MREHMKRFLFCFALLLMPTLAHAYIGPGAAIGLIGYFFGLAGIGVAAVLMVLYFPIKWAFLAIRGKKKPIESNSPPEKSL